jgi:hypothetical protein
VPKKVFRTFLLLMIALLLLFLVIQSRSSDRYQSLAVDWYYTIPDGYQGFLVIRYDCTGGKPLVIQNEEIHLEFNNDGTACIKDAFQPTHGQDFAQDKSGRSVRVVGSPWNDKGYALYGQGVMSIGRYGKDYGTFEVLWAGDMEYLAKQYFRGLDQFLDDRFGVPTAK